VSAISVVAALAQMGAGVRRGPAPKVESPEEWRGILDLAARHRVAPLVREALSGAPGDLAPAPIAAAFREQAFLASATRMLCEGALERLLAVTASRGIEVLVLKGATLAHSVYPRPELRVYHDLDVLCRPRDYARLREALLASGHTCAPFAAASTSDGSHETLAPKPSPIESHSVRAFYDPSGDVKIEVHFDLLQLGLLDRHHEEFFREARTLSAGPLEIPVLAPEHRFLHLAVHAQRHCFSRLGWLVDLDLVVRRQGDRLDWERVVRLARDEGVGQVIRHVLATLNRLLGTPSPALPPPTLEERLLASCYRCLWPVGDVGRADRREHRRLMLFRPDADDLGPGVLYGLVLVGRRREKLQALSMRARGVRG